MAVIKESDFEYNTILQGEDIILHINYEKAASTPSIEDDPHCMAFVIERLIESPNVTKIVFSQKRDYEYDYSQVQLLLEIGKLYNTLVKQKNQLFSYQALGGDAYGKYARTAVAEVQEIVFKLLKTDPLACFVELRRLIRHKRIAKDKSLDPKFIEFTDRYIKVLSYILNLLENTSLIRVAKPYLDGYKVGQRDIYRRIFAPIIKPDFMFTKLMAAYPENGIEVDSYNVGETEVTIFRFPDSCKTLYHVMPPEFKLDEDQYELLDLARKILAEHKPKRSEFTNPKRMREVFSNIGKDLLEELAEYRGIRLKEEELNELTKILVRYTVGFGLVEVLLSDEKIQDISINSPMGRIPIFLVHSDYDDCDTNIIITPNEADSWASKLRMISGRPLDEANPILDTELELPGASARVSVVGQPLDPTGLAFSFRRHRDRPWTLPLFIKYKMINPLAAGLLSFLIDGTRTMIIAGTRSSGKSSFLSSLMIEIMRRFRIITIEDTLELPTNSMRKLGYNIQALRVASAFSQSGSEVDASIGIRTTLRLGDSSLIIGEVRSKEAIALYEAMRVGAAANVVAGTIHGDSPYGVFDRVVNDIGVPRTSFKATDIIIIASPIKSADGLHKYRRITEITEVRKTWEQDPLLEGGFVDLMKYNVTKDELEVTDDLKNGNSEILKTIAEKIKDFSGNWDLLWENIVLRGDLKAYLVELSDKLKDPELLEAEFVIKCNDMFHNITDKVREERGFLDHKRIKEEWIDWVNREVRLRKIE